jgi:hypothetical protein
MANKSYGLCCFRNTSRLSHKLAVNAYLAKSFPESYELSRYRLKRNFLDKFVCFDVLSGAIFGFRWFGYSPLIQFRFRGNQPRGAKNINVYIATNQQPVQGLWPPRDFQGCESYD